MNLFATNFAVNSYRFGLDGQELSTITLKDLSVNVSDLIQDFSPLLKK